MVLIRFVEQEKIAKFEAHYMHTSKGAATEGSAVFSGDFHEFFLIF